MSHVPGLRPISDHQDSWVFDHYTRLFRRLRPSYPEAIVFEVDAGEPDDANVRLVADTRTADRDVEIMLSREVLREAPELEDITSDA